MTDNNPIRSAVREAIARAIVLGVNNNAIAVAAAAMKAHVQALEAAGWTLIPPATGVVTPLTVADHRIRRKRGDVVEIPHEETVA